MARQAQVLAAGNAFFYANGTPTWRLFVAVIVVVALICLVFLLLRSPERARNDDSLLATSNSFASSFLRGYALALIDTQQFAEAQEALVPYLTRFPADALMHALSGAASAQMGNHAAAIAELDRGAQIMRRGLRSLGKQEANIYTQLLSVLAQEYAAVGQNAQASAVAAELQQLVSGHMQGSVAPRTLMDAMRNAERERQATERITDWETGAPPPRALGLTDSGAAVRFFKRALRQQPGDGRLLADLAQALHASGDHRAAEKTFTESLRAAPNDPWAHFDFGTMHWRLGRLQDADRELRAAAQLAPDSAAILGTYALLLARLGKDEDAERLLVTCIQANPSTWVFLRLYGSAMARRNRMAEAVQAFRQADRQGASDAAFRFEYADALAQTDSPEAADEQFRLAVRSENGTGRARARYGLFLIDRGRFDEAEEHLKQALLWPDSEEAHLGLAALYLKERRMEEALPHLQMALQYDPQSPRARECHAEWLLLRGQADEALATVQRLVEEGTARGTLHLIRGGALRALNRELEAETALREANRLDPALAPTLLAHARSLRMLRYYHAAQESLAQCLALAPGWPEALEEEQSIRSEASLRPAPWRTQR